MQPHFLLGVPSSPHRAAPLRLRLSLSALILLTARRAILGNDCSGGRALDPKSEVIQVLHAAVLRAMLCSSPCVLHKFTSGHAMQVSV